MSKNKNSHESRKVLQFAPKEKQYPPEELEYTPIQKLQLAIELERNELECMSKTSFEQNQNLNEDVRLLYRSRNFDNMCCDLMRAEMDQQSEQLDI